MINESSMDIQIKGRYFSKEKRELIIDFVDWCGKKLLGKRLSKGVSVTVHVVGPKIYNKQRLYGTTDFSDDDDLWKPRNFTITITNRFEILRTLIIVAHEMVHVKQHAKSELSYCSRTQLPKWQGVHVDDEKINYWDLPWEIEAHGREKGLVYQWAQDKDHTDKRWLKEVI